MNPLVEKFIDWWRERRNARLYPEKAIVVGFDEATIWRTEPGEPRQEIAWDRLRRVVIHTTDEGPFQPDVFWHLEADADAHLIFPSGATGSSEALERLQTLPDFDNHAVLAAMVSTDNALFLCWQRPPEG